MPIAVRVVNDKEFASWVDQAKKNFASDELAPENSWRRPTRRRSEF